MTRTLLAFSALLCVSGQGLMAQEDKTEPATPTRPGDEAGEIPVSDSLADCASILAIASGLTNNLVYRNSYSQQAGTWFATSGDVALQDGGLPAKDAWEKKVANWSGQITSVDGLAGHKDWMSYCAHIGGEHGLDTSLFATYAE